METRAISGTKLAVVQAKKIGIDGTITYYYSLPKISIFNIKGVLWLWRRLREYKKVRKESGEIITKVIYN